LKLGKISWIILTVGVCVIAFASVGAAHAQKVNDQERVSEELSTAKLMLSKIKLEELNVRQQELEEEVEQATSDFEAVKAELSQPNESIPVVGELFDIAGACNVEITEIRSSGLGDDELTSIKCSVQSITLRAVGDPSDLIRFVHKLNNGFTTGHVKSVEINISGTDEEGQEQVSAVSVSMIIYSYEGS